MEAERERKAEQWNREEREIKRGERRREREREKNREGEGSKLKLRKQQLQLRGKNNGWEEGREGERGREKEIKREEYAVAEANIAGCHNGRYGGEAKRKRPKWESTKG